MPLKVLHIQSFDWGGAAIAARRLHEGLINTGVESAMLLKWKSKFNVNNTYEYKAPPEIYTFSRKFKNKLKQIKSKIKTEEKPPDYLANAPEGYHQFTLPQSKFNVLQSPLVAQADIVHLHWVADFIDDTTFFKNINKPVVWTMHDMNPFTGGCHCAMDCSNYKQDCGLCPQLAGTINPSYSSDILKIKNRSVTNTPVHIVTPSLWLSECSKTSSVMKNLPHQVIPNGFPSGVFVSRDKNFSRSVFGLPLDKKIALFVSGDIHCKPKGYHLLKEALTKTGLPEDLILCAVGEKHLDIDSGSNVIELGPITDERLLSLVYSAADVFITPSLADNLPNTVVESILCGTPVIAFKIGGLSNMLTHGANGLFCPDISTGSLAKTISEFFNKQHTFINEDISREAHAVYDIEIVADQYVKLYKTILKRDE